MKFYKYQGTGNDFIILDNRDGSISLSTQQIAALCHRRLGIGADGLMLLGTADGYDFSMTYYNADGGESTMCGNGGRCMSAFARYLGLVTNTASFIAIDGPHTAQLNADGLISLHMKDVAGMAIHEGHTILNTGSPHYVLWHKNVQAADVFRDGRAIRQQHPPHGINVNFVQLGLDGLYVRTYERGVEDETLSCGTGVTASAIAATCKQTGDFNTHVETPGGKLQVAFHKPSPLSATHVVLTGPATFVFSGEISL